MTLTETIKSGALDGYRPRAPRADVAAEDAAMCAEMTCLCGHIGLEYRPFSRPGSYLFYAVCSACGCTLEI